MTLRYAYGTNGLADHRLDDAIALLADHGYAGISLTLDHHHLDPFAEDLAARVSRVGRLLERYGLDVVIETGARFLLDPRRKHEPTLVSPAGRERRIELLRRAIAIAADLGAPVVSLWSGTADGDAGEAWARLVDGVAIALEQAESRGIALGFEPEPGMVVDTIAAYERLAEALGRPARLGLTLDVGHCRCNEPADPAACVAGAGAAIVHVQIEDMRRGVHEHLPFGEGEIDFPPVLAALRRIGYRGLVSVELTRHSHAAHLMVPGSIAFLRDAETEASVA